MTNVHMDMWTLKFFLKNVEASEWALRSGKLKGILKSLFD